MSISTTAAYKAGSFGISVNRISIVKKGVYHITDNRGIKYCLKRMPMSIRRLRWADQTLRRMKGAGFSASAWRSASAAGSRLFARLKGRPYVLTPWLKGRMPSVYSHWDMEACGAALARFHRAGSDSRSAHRCPESRRGKWPLMIARMHQQLASQVAMGKQGKYGSPINQLLKRHGNEILNYSKQAQLLLQQSNYKALSGSRHPSFTVCHGDGGPSNFIMNSKGTYLIDFETITADLRAYDLYRILYNSCKEYGWNMEIAKSILKGYRQINGLQRSDYQMMRIWLRFPRSIHLLLREYRRSNAKGRARLERQFMLILNRERQMGRFLQRLEREFK